MNPIHNHPTVTCGRPWAAGARRRQRHLFLLLGAVLLGGGVSHQAMAQGIQSLRADPSGHFLVTEDGKPFVWQGDTLWGALSLGPADIDYYLDTRKAQGFNVVQIDGASERLCGQPAVRANEPS